MEIRQATLDDDLNKIAELIYNTDIYIYPYWFKKTPNYVDVLIDIMKTEGTIFYYKNIYIAVEEKKVLGILVCFDNNTNLNSTYHKWIHINKNFNYTINKYLLALVNHRKEDYVYISNVCVRKSKRRQHIGTKLLNYILEQFPTKNFELAVLQSNIPGINLYTKLGFEIVESTKGFNGPLRKKPRIYNMEKVIKNKKDD